MRCCLEQTGIRLCCAIVFTSDRTRISHHVPIAMPSIFLCCPVVVVFDRSSFRRNYLQSMRADDRSKGDGFQMEKRKGYIAGDVRKE